MSNALRHRGPDDSGATLLKARNGAAAGSFAHRRLAILDLSSAGHQPMLSPDQRLSITYNGEIYNFADLKSELQAGGAVFRSACDTEVILEGWARHGIAFLRRLRGMYAMAIWDSGKDEGCLIRDPFGIKPLYVAQRNNAVLFASEVRALVATGLVERRISAPAVASYLSTGSVAEPLTIVEGIEAIPPGCAVPVARAESGFTLGEPVRFATMFREGGETREAVGTHARRVRDALRDSVSYHLVSDVPVALFLSGGIDSAAVAGLASEVASTRLESFTVTFSEEQYSEAGLARETARRLSTSHHEIHLTARDTLDSLSGFFAAMDQPSLDGLNTFIVSRAVRSSGIKVVLSGLGGDELFAGYPAFHRARMIAPFWKTPSPVRGLFASAFRPFDDPRAARIEALLSSRTASQAAYAASRTLYSDPQLRRLLPSHGPLPIAPDERDGIRLASLSLLQQVSLLELAGYMRNTLLRDSDVFSMAHGLELRVPFLDPIVAQAAASAGDAEKLRRGESKPLLVDAVRDLLPPAVIAGPKKGFTLPFEAWMRGELLSEIDSVLCGNTGRTGLDQSAVKDVWQAFQRRRPGFSWSRPWALYTLIRWAEHHGFSVGDSVPGKLPSEEYLSLTG